MCLIATLSKTAYFLNYRKLTHIAWATILVRVENLLILQNMVNNKLLTQQFLNIELLRTATDTYSFKTIFLQMLNITFR